MNFRAYKSCSFCTRVLLVALICLELAVSVPLPYTKTTFNETVYGNVSKDNDNLWMYEYTRRKGIVSILLLEDKICPSFVTSVLGNSCRGSGDGVFKPGRACLPTFFCGFIAQMTDHCILPFNS